MMEKTALFDLEGRVAVVSGASRGIGAASAELLAQQGAQVVVCSRKLDACEAIAESIRAQGGQALALPCHIGEPEQIQDLMAEVDKRFGRLDILVNNAATNPFFGHVLDTDLDAYQKVVDVNIRGYFLMSVAAGRLMKRAGCGSIVNIASINGRCPGELQGIYSISKAAVINMTQVFAKECAALGIRCNAVLPGLTDTRFASALTGNPAILKEALKRIPMKRVAQPSEIATAVLYFASDASSYATGTTLTVDGGMLS